MVAASDVERDEATGQVTAPIDDADIFQIEVGDCFDSVDVDSEVFESLPVVPCADPHDSEVYLAFDLTGDVYPGQPAIEAEYQRCIGEEFTAFVGMAYETSVYEVLPFSPTEQSWAAGDREILCSLSDPGGPITGSAAGTNR